MAKQLKSESTSLTDSSQTLQKCLVLLQELVSEVRLSNTFSRLLLGVGLTDPEVLQKRLESQPVVTLPQAISSDQIMEGV